MNLYYVECTIKESDNKFVTKAERLPAESWQSALETMAAVMRDTGHVVVRIYINSTSDQPFGLGAVEI